MGAGGASGSPEQAVTDEAAPGQFSSFYILLRKIKPKTKVKRKIRSKTKTKRKVRHNITTKIKTETKTRTKINPNAKARTLKHTLKYTADTRA